MTVILFSISALLLFVSAAFVVWMRATPATEDRETST